MFVKDRFIQDCINALADGQEAVREVVADAISDHARLMSELGEPERAGLTSIYRSHDLTIMKHVWAPFMTLMPHNHQMFAVVGIYSGREDNVFWRRRQTTIEAAGAKSLGVGDIAMLVWCRRSSLHKSFVIPASKARRESFLENDSRQAGMTRLIKFISATPH